MAAKYSVLIVCSKAADAEPMVSELGANGMESTIARGADEADWTLRDRTFDLIVVESDLDGSPGTDLLVNVRQAHPAMGRILLETQPITMSWRSLVNQIAPSAVFEGSVDAKRMVEILEEDGNRSKGKSGEARDRFLAETWDAFTRMRQDPKLRLPVLPEIAEQIDKLLVDEKKSFKEIAQWVRREQSVAARILQVANSPIYRSIEPIRNLSQAVGRLGLREARHVLQAVIVENLFRTHGKGRKEMMRELWLHSLSTAYCNERIAQTLHMPKSEDYFMMGLLHDIGKLLILHLIDLGVEKRYWSEREVSADVIRRLMILHHNELGASLVRSWSYPTMFQQVIRRHNDRRYAEYHSEPVIVTHISNMVVHKVGYSFVPHDDAELSPADIADALNMNRSMHQELEASLIDTIEAIKHSCFTDFHARRNHG